MTSHTRHWKEKQLAELKKLIDDSSVVAIASIENIPASLLQELRSKLADTAIIKVSKKKVIERALAESKFKGLGLEKYLRGQVALVTGNTDPFELYSLLKKNKINAYLKVGSVAEKDIVVPAGDTGLAPGPDLSVLKAANIPAVMKGNSIQVPKDTVVVHKGEQVTPEVAAALIKLDIKPAEIMLKIQAASDGHMLYDGSILNIDAEKFEQDLIACYRNAFNLAFNIEYFMPENIELFLQKAFTEAKALAVEAEFLNSVTLPEFIAKAQANANVLSSLVTFDEPKAKVKAEEQSESKKTEEQQKGEEGAPEAGEAKVKAEEQTAQQNN